MKKSKRAGVPDPRQYLDSSHREKVVEHLFLGELLRHLWVKRISGVQVLKPEVDAAGYDVVLSLGPILRHVQLKASMHDARARSQPVHQALATHPSGCVVWIVLRDDLRFERFLWFGGAPGEPLPSLSGFARAKHTRANKDGVKSIRVGTWRIPQSKFVPVADLDGLVTRLFGPVG